LPLFPSFTFLGFFTGYGPLRFVRLQGNKRLGGAVDIAMLLQMYFLSLLLICSLQVVQGMKKKKFFLRGWLFLLYWP